MKDSGEWSYGLLHFTLFEFVGFVTTIFNIIYYCDLSSGVKIVQLDRYEHHWKIKLTPWCYFNTPVCTYNLFTCMIWTAVLYINPRWDFQYHVTSTIHQENDLYLWSHVTNVTCPISCHSSGVTTCIQGVPEKRKPKFSVTLLNN